MYGVIVDCAVYDFVCVIMSTAKTHFCVAYY